jgi:hypothetical protein
MTVIEGSMKEKTHECYIANVKNAIFRNLRWFIDHGEDKEFFLEKVMAYCEKLQADPEEPRVPRKRIRSGNKYTTKR